MKIFHVDIDTFDFIKISKERLFDIAGKLLRNLEVKDFDPSHEHYKAFPILDLPYGNQCIVFAANEQSARNKLQKYIDEVNRIYKQVREENAV